MKKIFTVFTLLFSLILLSSCSDSGTQISGENPPLEAADPQAPIDSPPSTDEDSTHEQGAENLEIIVTVGESQFNATLEESAAAKEFYQMLPLTASMNELNGNEKYFSLSRDLSSEDARVSFIEEGDIMLYSSDTLVLFYESFSTSYSYTRLGKITDTNGLARSLGSGNVTVTFAPVGTTPEPTETASAFNLETKN